ncbi:MAG: DUF1015 family protein [Acidimicrobiia bacterium]
MPRFEPFRGLRYDPDYFLMENVTAPPYDVIDAAQRQALADRSKYNVVRIDVPPEDGYDAARATMDEWRETSVLIQDDEPTFYVYRMGFKDELGRAHQTSGVIGALELMNPGEGDVLPHEQTTPKAKSDRLQLMRSTNANLSPVWGLSLASGLSALCELPGQPVARWTDDDGVHHRLYRVVEPGVIASISETVDAQPVVIADGHHRYAVSLQYRDERRAVIGTGPHDLTMTLMVELAADQLFVRAIHRLVAGLPEGYDLLSALDPWFEAFSTTPADVSLTDRMGDAGALALVAPTGDTWLLRPRDGVFDGVPDLDSARLDHALAGCGAPYSLTYQHGVDNIVRLVKDGAAQFGVFLRPVTVANIAATAHERRLMPPKSTFFTPKPRTGVVIRLLD